jgi:hypothetical protein
VSRWRGAPPPSEARWCGNDPAQKQPLPWLLLLHLLLRSCTCCSFLCAVGLSSFYHQNHQMQWSRILLGSCWAGSEGIGNGRQKDNSNQTTIWGIS